MLAVVPKIRRLQRAKKSKVMKGRPITENEFERMLAKVADTVGEDAAPSWKHYLQGLWWSGLRLAESLELWWDNDAKLQMVFVGKDLMLRIPADLEKGNKDRILPIAPEFADFLLRTPDEERHGRVFKLQPQKVRGERLTADRVTRLVSKIGVAAGVLVDKGRNKFATAHDLRRSFGERWAERVMPQVLMEPMRHESIETTLKYYVGRNAQRTARIVREAYEETLKKKAQQGKNQPKTRSRDTLRDTPTSER
jgi:integrase